MKAYNYFPLASQLLSVSIVSLLFLNTATSFAQKAADKPAKPASPGKRVPGPFPATYKTTDNRTAVIGAQTATDGGWKFDNAHINPCWLADGFNFKGYDVLYIAPTASSVTVKAEEQAIYD